MADSKKREVAAWLQKAENDMRGARIDMEAAPPLIEDALFHCQQAAEKAMKAFLTAHDTLFSKTHDLDELAMACEEIDASLKEALGPARNLSIFAWEFRYPGDNVIPSEKEAYDAIVTAERVVMAVHQRLAG
ncbi:MAG: HEPN domain-containing protein [Lentisphaerae bacterium]|nr:HEPN domain-containing protein [Lentisphaerota bacterium]